MTAVKEVRIEWLRFDHNMVVGKEVRIVINYTLEYVLVDSVV